MNPPQGITLERLVELYPRLFHMAAGGSWPSIAANGLLPTLELIGSSGLDADEQEQLLTRRRDISRQVEHPKLGQVTIRDQLPLREKFLTPKLVDMTLEQWLETLNDRVFFWLHPDKLRGLLSARAYRGSEHDVLTCDTASLVGAHLNQVRLSPINSGSTLYPNAPSRGPATFSRLEDYPFAARRARVNVANSIVELAVIGGVIDVAEHVIGVDRYLGPQFQYSILGHSHPV